MREKENHPSRHEPQSVIGNCSDNSCRLLQALSQTSAIGFAVLDDQMRYQAINRCLADINGMPAKDHLGVGVRELFGELSEKIAEPAYHRVLDRGETSQFEFKNAVLPKRPERCFWALKINFPIGSRDGGVYEIGTAVLDVTEQRRLQECIHQLASELRHTATKEMFWQPRHFQDSIDDYHTALAQSLELLLRRQRNTEQLAHSIEVLDQVIVAMRKLVTNTAASFPIARSPNDR